MPKKGPEYRFEQRLIRRFEWAGCVVLKSAGSRPWDLTVMRKGIALALELKPLGEDITPEQRARQYALAKKAGVGLVLLRQFPEGKVKAVYLLDGPFPPLFYSMIKEALGEYHLEV